MTDLTPPTPNRIPLVEQILDTLERTLEGSEAESILIEIAAVVIARHVHPTSSDEIDEHPMVLAATTYDHGRN